ncbi:hypothetical protein KEJ15_05455 [Candidatus Bathyarchaeota archaeon]|nr:hypothetical protein [Candidatus Bathyarchaeota archaeon]
MHKSKLETYEDILQALVSKPLTIDKIAFETAMDCSILRNRLEFLLKNELIEERNVRNKQLYAITERGTMVLKTLNFQKYLDKVVDKLSVIDEAMHVMPSISKVQRQRREAGQ